VYLQAIAASTATYACSVMTYKPSTLGKYFFLVCDQSSLVNLHAGLQVSTSLGYNLCHSG